MREKGERQAALRRLVRQRAMANQNEMVQLLQDLGFHATQASVSRDVRELGLVRVDGRYVPATGLGLDRGEDGGVAVPNELIISVEPVGANLIVVKTPPGVASAVALELDQNPRAEMVGTVAGDDTIFVAVRSRSAQGRTLALLKGVTRGSQTSATGRRGKGTTGAGYEPETSGGAQP
ncbi:MAG: arginine repressor [Planctomycetota bacterium]